ncbi:MAG: hypothetical protein ACETWG_05635 [Candidatus Neomarinimicrobiota bacterium]
MSFYTILRFFHVLLVALYVGSFTAIAFLWIRSRQLNDPAARLPYIDAAVSISQRLTTMAGSILLLVGILMIINWPGVLGYGVLFYIKISIGVLLVAVSHIAHAMAKRARDALAAGRTDARAERFVDLTVRIGPAIAFIIVFLGVMVSHG